VSEDDRAVMERLAALEAEVKADEDAKRVRKEAALQKVREQRAAQQAERDELRERQAAMVKKKRAPSPEPREDEEDSSTEGDLSGALELAKKADGVRKELARKGEKSWVKSGAASLLLGPIGWLYAGSLREAVPASAAYIAFMAVASKLLPLFILWPVMLVALPLSGIAGIMYAVQFNKHGARQRLWDKDKDKKKNLDAKELKRLKGE
jgi:hypothetical protein